MKINEKGFFTPTIDESKCINCNLCDNVCLNKTSSVCSEPLFVYACFSENNQLRESCTSGGVFTVLAEYVIKKGGYVFGASLQENLSVKHICVDTIEELDKIKKSKYLQSEIGETFHQVKTLLNKVKLVLFSGTPCQISGLKLFLQKDYPNLLTVDVLCHGVPSKKMFDKYVQFEEEQYGSKLVNMDFRCKELGWKNYFTKRIFENDTINTNDTFVPGYLSDFFLNDSCYNCKFANSYRLGDISLGDYWGYKEKAPKYIEDDNKGISLVLLNSEKGRLFFNKIKKELICEKRSFDDAVKGNPILQHPTLKPVQYVNFWKDVYLMNWDELQIKYFYNQQPKDILSKNKKDYFEIPYNKRHIKHWIKYTKKSFKNKF